MSSLLATNPVEIYLSLNSGFRPMPLLTILTISFLTGSLIKLSDDITDKKMAIPDLFAIPSGLIYGLLMGFLMTIDMGASCLFGGIVLGCLVTGKIDTSGHYFGLLGILVVIFYYGFHLSPLILLVGVFAAVDELKGITHVPSSLEFIFDYRLVLKVGVLILVALNILELNTLIILLTFDLAYIMTNRLTSRFPNEV